MWHKAVADCWLQWAISAAILVGFSWIFIWLMSQVPAAALSPLMQVVGKVVEKVAGLPVDDLISTPGRVSVLFVHVVTMLVCVGWAVGRGSAPISGEIGRGRMDILATLPVRRPTLLFIPAVVSTAGALLLALALWAGIALGIRTIALEEPVSPGRFAPGAVNLFSLIFCLTGMTCLVSAWIVDRWRAIFITVGFFLVSMIIEMVSRMWPGGSWLRYASFLTAFRPQQLILYADPGSEVAFRCNAVLIGLGLLCYFAAAVVFWRRDIPAAR
ncbi:MAG: hypothetical protein JXB10_05510 [Pirellulales bacterium]|nr:hypothetical protein [Pirellulales bacterium]